MDPPRSRGSASGVVYSIASSIERRSLSSGTKVEPTGHLHGGHDVIDATDEAQQGHYRPFAIKRCDFRPSRSLLRLPRGRGERCNQGARLYPHNEDLPFIFLAYGHEPAKDAHSRVFLGLRLVLAKKQHLDAGGAVSLRVSRLPWLSSRFPQADPSKRGEPTQVLREYCRYPRRPKIGRASCRERV